MTRRYSLKEGIFVPYKLNTNVLIHERKRTAGTLFKCVQIFANTGVPKPIYKIWNTFLGVSSTMGTLMSQELIFIQTFCYIKITLN